MGSPSRNRRVRSPFKEVRALSSIFTGAP